MRAVVLVTLLLAACQPTESLADVSSESGAGVLLEPERNVVLLTRGILVQVTNPPGAEELEAVSPDGTWVAFASDTTGRASHRAEALPTDAVSKPAPIQLTSVDPERARRTRSQSPEEFIPMPDDAKGPRWVDDRTLACTAQGVGVGYTAAVSR